MMTVIWLKIVINYTHNTHTKTNMNELVRKHLCVRPERQQVRILPTATYFEGNICVCVRVRSLRVLVFVYVQRHHRSSHTQVFYHIHTHVNDFWRHPHMLWPLLPEATVVLSVCICLCVFIHLHRFTSSSMLLSLCPRCSVGCRRCRFASAVCIFGKTHLAVR